MGSRSWKLVATGVAALAVVGAGGAVAATGLGTPQEESKAVLDDAAKQLGVDSAKLDAALKKALANRVDAAVAAGELTKAQGAELKARIQSGDYPLLGVGRGPGHHGGGHHGGGPLGPGLDAAADYLGLTEAELRAAIEEGKSLADVAKEEGKSVDGLVGALTDAAKERLDAAVAAGRLTQAQADEMLSGLKERLTEAVNEDRPLFGHRGFRGAPPDADGSSFTPSSFDTAA